MPGDKSKIKIKIPLYSRPTSIIMLCKLVMEKYQSVAWSFPSLHTIEIPKEGFVLLTFHNLKLSTHVLLHMCRANTLSWSPSFILKYA